MTENNQNSQATQPHFSIEKLYVKDLSLEVPNAPKIYLEREAPQINIQLRPEFDLIEDDMYDVTLTLTVSAQLPGEKTMFLVEVAQAGIFQVRNLPADNLEPLMLITCPTILFPYASEAVSNSVTRAGFPPVNLAPVNFEGLYQAQKQQQMAANANPEAQTTLQ